MPFAVRRADGKFLKKVTSGKSWVDDFEEASTWTGSGHASSSLAAMSARELGILVDSPGESVTVEIVEVERRVAGVKHAIVFELTTEQDHYRRHKIKSTRTAPPSSKFRTMDEG